MKPCYSISNRSGPMVQWPLLGILVGFIVGIILRNWTLGMAVGLLGGVVFLHANFQMEGRKDKFFLAAFYAVVLLGLVLAACGRPELVWLILFVAILIDILRKDRQ